MDCKEKILSQDYWDLIIPPYDDSLIKAFPEEKSCVQDLGYGYRTVTVETGQLGEVSIEKYGYNSISSCYGLLDLSVMGEAGISTVQNLPSLGLKGEGVIIGFVDTGIDYRHPAFKNTDGTSRIISIWDQTIQTGNPPEGFLYGSEYTEEDINEALGAPEGGRPLVPSRDDNGHGTFLASVAAGNYDEDNAFTGAAPSAQIVVVKLKEAKKNIKAFYGISEDKMCFQDTDVLQGLKYLHLKADREGKPLVMCIALGTNLGGHNGRSVMSRMIDEYANTLERCVLVGVGNEASRRHHYSGDIEESPGSAKEVEFRVEENCRSFVAELWSSLPNILTVYIVSPTGEKTPKISVRQGSRYSFSFIFDNTEVIVEYRLMVNNNSSQMIFMKFSGNSPGIWRIGVESVYTIGGVFHIWLSMQDFLSGNVYFLESNPNDTMTDPGSAKGAITVAYYNSHENSVDINSGRGYTRGGYVKPDITAPGVKIMGALLGGGYGLKSGSSAATGIASGAAALLIEWLKTRPEINAITTSQVSNIMILGANREILPTYPNKEWGYGTLDVFHSLEQLRRI